MRTPLRRHRRYIVGLLLVPCGIAGAGAVLPASAARPLVTISEAPPSSWSHPEAIFRFRTRATDVACSRDTLRFQRCRHTIKYSGMRVGRHKFTLRVRFRGKTSFVSRRWTVQRARNARQMARAPAAGGNAATLLGDPSLAAPAPRKLILSDEFDGTTLDLSRWRPFFGPGHANYGLRRPSAVALDGQGHLVVTGRMQGRKIVAGGIANQQNFTYGRVEFRVKTEPDPTGTMSGVVLTWPKQQWSPEYTENDMYETGPHAGNRSRFDTFVHFGRTLDFQKLTTHDINPSIWHTIAMEWYPNLLEITVDGVLDFSISDPGVIPDILHHVSIQLDARANTRLKRPQRMWVDYVRVYQ